jgi:hypothetical protein
VFGWFSLSASPLLRAGICFGITAVGLATWADLAVKRHDELRRQRWQRRRCFRCGYDMRITPRRCPECGSIPPRTLFDLDQISIEERHAIWHTINRVDRWPRGVLLALWFVIPFFVTLVTCLRWSVR